MSVRCLARPFLSASRSVGHSAVQAPWKRSFSVTLPVLEKRYTREHEWVDVNREAQTAVIGISEYAAKQLGDIVYVELPAAGSVVTGGDAIGAVESVKSAADINSPVSGTVQGTNALLEEKPSLINQEPENEHSGGGWIAKLALADDSLQQFDQLLDEKSYAAYVEGGSDH